MFINFFSNYTKPKFTSAFNLVNIYLFLCDFLNVQKLKQKMVIRMSRLKKKSKSKSVQKAKGKIYIHKKNISIVMFP